MHAVKDLNLDVMMSRYTTIQPLEAAQRFHVALQWVFCWHLYPNEGVGFARVERGGLSVSASVERWL